MFADRSKRGADFHISRAHRGQTFQYSESVLFKVWGRQWLANSSSDLWQWNRRKHEGNYHMCAWHNVWINNWRVNYLTSYGYRLGFNPCKQAKTQSYFLHAMPDNQPFPGCIDGGSTKGAAHAWSKAFGNVQWQYNTTTNTDTLEFYTSRLRILQQW